MRMHIILTRYFLEITLSRVNLHSGSVWSHIGKEIEKDDSLHEKEKEEELWILFENTPTSPILLAMRRKIELTFPVVALLSISWSLIIVGGADGVSDFSLVCRKGYRLTSICRANSGFQRSIAGSLSVECERIVSGADAKQVRWIQFVFVFNLNSFFIMLDRFLSWMKNWIKIENMNMYNMYNKLMRLKNTVGFSDR